MPLPRLGKMAQALSVRLDYRRRPRRMLSLPTKAQKTKAYIASAVRSCGPRRAPARQPARCSLESNAVGYWSTRCEYPISNYPRNRVNSTLHLGVLRLELPQACQIARLTTQRRRSDGALWRQAEPHANRKTCRAYTKNEPSKRGAIVRAR